MECKGCEQGIAMCHHRPCMGTPEEFEKIIKAGFADKLRIDYWIGTPQKDRTPDRDKLAAILVGLLGIDNYENPFEEDVYFLTGGTQHDKDFKSELVPTGSCKLLTEDNLCSLHDLGLKPEQGALSCCKDEKNEANENLHYVNLWATDKGREVVKLFKETVGIQ